MKYFFTILSIIFISFPVKGQEEIELPKNEFSFNLLSVKNRYVVEGGKKYYLNFLHGLSYKRHFNKNAIRFNFNYFQKIDKIDNSQSESSGNYSEIEFGLGYQRGFLNSWIKPYIAVDLKIMGGNLVEERNNNLNPSYEKYDINKLGIGISPTLGVKFETKTPLSFSIETNVEMLMYREEGSVYFWSPTEIPDLSDVNKSDYRSRFNPVTAFFISLEF